MQTAIPTNPVNQKNYRIDSLVGYILLSLAVLALGGWLTYLGMGQWYNELRKPSWQPPGWVFSPVWTTLLTLLAIATWRVSGRMDSPMARVALGLYVIQLVLNVSWSLLFFALHSPQAALVEIFLLDLVLIGMVISYSRVCKLAGSLIVPYAVWLGLATAINIWIVWNN